MMQQLPPYNAQALDEALRLLNHIKMRGGWRTAEQAEEDPEYREAAWAVVTLNMRLVEWVLRRHKLPPGVSEDDIRSDLVETLFRCCYRYEPTYGKFSTLAVSSLSRRITTKVGDEMRQRLFAVPRHLSRAEIERRLQLLPGEIEEAFAQEKTFTNIDEGDLLRAAAGYNPALPTSRHWAGEPGEQTLWEDNALEGGQSVTQQDLDVPDAFEAAAASELKRIVQEMLTGLQDKERLVLTWRYGLDGGEEKTLNQVGAEMGVTKERVRQIQSGAERHLRHPLYARKLQQYLTYSPSHAPHNVKAWLYVRCNVGARILLKGTTDLSFALPNGDQVQTHSLFAAIVHGKKDYRIKFVDDRLFVMRHRKVFPKFDQAITYLVRLGYEPANQEWQGAMRGRLGEPTIISMFGKD